MVSEGMASNVLDVMAVIGLSRLVRLSTFPEVCSMLVPFCCKSSLVILGGVVANAGCDEDDPYIT